jgi:hypothetical protein
MIYTDSLLNARNAVPGSPITRAGLSCSRSLRGGFDTQGTQTPHSWPFYPAPVLSQYTIAVYLTWKGQLFPGLTISRVDGITLINFFKLNEYFCIAHIHSQDAHALGVYIFMHRGRYYNSPEVTACGLLLKLNSPIRYGINKWSMPNVINSAVVYHCVLFNARP